MEREELAKRILAEVTEPGIQAFSGKMPIGVGPYKPDALVFKVTCECKVTAMLSVDIPPEASDEKVDEMVPHLASALDRQARQFHNLPCEVHARVSMR